MWRLWAAPTTVALINYPDFQAARIARADDSFFLRVERVAISDMAAASGADLVLIFGRGLSLDDAQRSALNELASRTEVFIESSTDPASDVTNLTGEWLDRVSAYLSAGGDTNFQNLLRYARAEIDGKRLAAPAAAVPEPVPMDLLFHLDDAARFASVADYETYANKNPLWLRGAKKIALVTSVPGPFNANREHVDAIIRAIAKRGHAVYPMAAVLKRLDFLKAIEPDAVVFMPHGRLTLDQGDEAVAWLRERNIPLISPVSVFRNVDEWRNDPQGFAGSLLTLSVTLPELDGGVAPYAVAALEPNDAGYEIFRAQPERLARLMDLLDAQLRLKDAANADKRIAIVYYKGPGQAALTAAELEVAPSLHRVLLALRDAGYDTGDLPEDFETFHARIKAQGRVLAPYAAGDQSAFFENGDPVRVSAAQLSAWCAQAGIEATCAAVDAQFGPAPGRYMVSVDGQIAVARAQFGKVVVMPQPLAGIGEDSFKVVHGTNKAPPHPYIAAYLWARYGFGADALMHFGTHGSLEFTPAKQVALTEADWADALLGGLPHAYLYTMANVGEAMIAKRRSYATTVSHLTPPIRGDAAANQVRQLRDALESAAQADGAVRRQAQVRARELAAEQGLTEELELPDGDWDTEHWQALGNLVEQLAAERITVGLRTIGQRYDADTRQQMVNLALRTALAETLARHAELTGQDAQPRADRLRFRQLYEARAKALIADVLGGRGVAETIAARLGGGWSAEAVQAAKQRLAERAAPSDAELIRNFIAMGRGAKKSADRPAAFEPANDAQIEAWVVTALASEGDVEFLRSLSSDKSFERASQTLDPEQLARAQRIARSIPPMAAALQVATQDHVRALLQAMQAPAMRQQVLALLDDAGLKNRVAAERKRQVRERREALRPQIDLPLMPADEQDDADLAHALSVLDRLDQWPDVASASEPAFAALSDAERRAALRAALQSEQARRAQHRDDLARAVVAVWDTLAGAQDLQAAMQASPAAELDSVLNVLSGGYISPSVGGDPVSVPAALPTGRNLYAVDAEKTPSDAAWRVGERMAIELIEAHVARHGQPPQKVAFTLWPGDFIQTEGALLAQVFALLGVEPIRDAFGRVVATRVVPDAQLNRPRVDVVIQTAGQFRDLAASRLTLIEQAIAQVAELDGENNAVARSTRAVESRLKQQGVAPAQARRLSTARVFGGANGAYGTEMMELVESGDRWQGDADLAEVYLNNMGAQYGSSERWMDYQAGLFEAVLEGTDALVQPRESNTWGALSLDHVYEFMGGLSLAARAVNGRDADAYFADFRNSSRAELSTLEETLAIETRATLLNPNYLVGLRDGGASSAEVLAETLRNAFGWEATRPAALDQHFWDETYAALIEDRNALGLKAWLDRVNPYADQEMTAVLLETARKGHWDANDVQLAALAERHAANVAEFGTSCSSFVCGNTALREFIQIRLDERAATDYAAAIDQSVLGSGGGQAVTLSRVENASSAAASGAAPDASERAPATAEGNPADEPQAGPAQGAEQGSAMKVLALGLALLMLGGLLVAGLRRRARGT